jgi:hypothetical protein
MRPLLSILLACSLLSAAGQQTGPVPDAAAPPPVQVHGLVTDSLTGKPVYDCLVGYYTMDGKRQAINPVNSDGRYALFVPPDTPFELRIEQENGYLERRLPLLALPPGSGPLRQDIRLQPKPH